MPREPMEIKWSRKTVLVALYSYAQNQKFTLIMAAFVVLLLIAILFCPLASSDLWKYTSVIITTLTFFAAVFLGVSNLYRAWEESLPKRLTVVFTTPDNAKIVSPPEFIMACENASLISEADIRAWGQQIGWQMVEEYLKFDLDLNWRSGKPLRMGDIAYKPYFAVIKLTAPPNFFNYVNELQKILWCYDFNRGTFRQCYLIDTPEGEKILNKEEFKRLLPSGETTRKATEKAH